MIKWNEFTVSNGAVEDVREMMFLTVFQDEDFDKFSTQVTGAKDGEKLAYIDTTQDVGTAGAGCDPTYTKLEVSGIEKSWEIDDWEIAKEICYKELEKTVAKYGMNAGTEIGDLENTPYWDYVLMPLLERVMVQMYWRIGWFGDKDAKNVTDGGIITDTVDVKLMKVCDGIWKRIFAIAAENESQRTEIAANDKATTKEQLAAIKGGNGVAMDIVDTMLADADSRILEQEGSMLMLTGTLYRALKKDLIEKTKYQLTIDQLMKGFEMFEYNGVNVVCMNVWDRMIAKYETASSTSGSTTTESRNNPHRALLASPENIFVGTEDTDKVADLDIWFDHKARKNYIYSTSKLGTLIGEDALIHVAY